ncbi:LamG-like jellyroll fold domain-containing protein, partial [bacterium]
VLRGNLYNNLSDYIGIGTDINGQNRFNGIIDEIRLSNLARQAWELHVNKSSIFAQNTTIDFGDVFVDQSRRVPYTFKNGGSDSLYIEDIFSPSTKVDISFDSDLVLSPAERAVIWITYSAESVGSFVPNDKIVIQSSDPTFPYFEVPCIGQGINQLKADPYPSDTFTLGLYHLDENNGTVLIDSSGNGMDGQCSSSMTWTTGNFSRALIFNDPSDICVITPDTNLHIMSPGLGGYSVETWFYMETIPSGESVLLSRGSDAGCQFDLRLSGNIVEAIFCNTVKDTFKLTSQTLSEPLEAQKWYHTAITYQEDIDLNRGTMHLYVNGDEVANTMMNGKIAGTNRAEWVDTLSVQIGRDWNMDAPFDGRLDEIRISQIDRQFWEFNMKLARMSLSADSIVFGNVRLENQRSIRVWFNNNGRDTLRVTQLVSSRPEFSVDLVNFNVAPGDSQYVTVTYTPLTQETHSGLLTLGSNDPLTPNAVISVRGTGVVDNPAGPYESDSFTLALFDFNTVNGDTILDGSGRGHYGLLHDGVSQTDSSNGLFSNGLYFNGVDGWVEIPSHPDFDFDITSESLTIEFIFKTGSTAQPMIYKGNTTTANYGISIDTNGRLYVNGFTSLFTGTELSFPVNDRSWHHVAFIFESGDSFARLYVGGILYDSLEADFSMDVVSDPLSIGSMTDTSNYYDGYIDQLRISNLARNIWEFPQSEPGIYIMSADPDTAIFGQNVTIQGKVPEDLVVTEFATYYRRTIGRGTYQKAVGIQDTSDITLYNLVLPEASLFPDAPEDLQGVEYYISVTTPDSTYTIPGNDPKNNPKALVVRYPDMTIHRKEKKKVIKRFLCFQFPLNSTAGMPRVYLQIWGYMIRTNGISTNMMKPFIITAATLIVQKC